MSTSYLDAKDVANVAHDAVYRVWFLLGGSVDMSAFGGLGDAEQRDAKDAVSSRMRSTYQNERVPTSIPPEYGEFWRRVVDSAVSLKYDSAADV